jgi:hypothetical protein
MPESPRDFSIAKFIVAEAVRLATEKGAQKGTVVVSLGTGVRFHPTSRD